MARAKNFAMCMVSTGALIVLASGCAKSDAPPAQAETPIGDVKFASAGMPAADMTYISDQSQVKLVTAPTVSYEPLETFRAARAAEGAGSADGEGDSGAAGVPSGKPGPVTKAKMALASMFGGLLGGGGAPGEMPPMPDVDAPDDDASATLMDMKDAMAELPAHPSSVTGEPVETAKAAALANARENLAKQVFTMKINEDETIAESLGDEADPKKLELSAAVMVAATWVNPNKLEVDVMCKLSDIVAELEQKFSSLDLTVIKALEQDKGLSAKGVADLKHENAPTRRARPGEMSRDAAEGGGGI